MLKWAAQFAARAVLIMSVWVFMARGFGAGLPNDVVTYERMVNLIYGVYTLDMGRMRQVLIGQSLSELPTYTNHSPDGAYRVETSFEDGDGDLYIIDNATGAPRQLTFSPEDDYYPVWLPDGDRILFVRFNRFTQADLYIINADGTGLRQLTREPGNESTPGGVLRGGL